MLSIFTTIQLWFTHEVREVIVGVVVGLIIAGGWAVAVMRFIEHLRRQDERAARSRAEYEKYLRDRQERTRKFEEYLRMTRQRPIEMPDDPDQRLKLLQALAHFMKLTTDEEVAAAMLLGVSVHALPDEVRVAFRNKAWKTHPDRAPAWDRDAAQERFVQLSEAKRVLEERYKRMKAQGWLR